MALYSFNVGQIKRSAGSSAVASAAYRAGEKLYSERYGEINDYTRKGGVLYTEIMLPDHAPREYSDRETLWNAVEEVEKRPDAQLAYSFMFTLQNEFSYEENLELARKFVKENFVARGMIADLAVHEKETDENGTANPHVHVMCPMRPLNDDSSWGVKQKSQLILDENGQPIWDENNRRWKVTSVPQTDWGDRNTLEEWRKNWCELCNEKFAEKGINTVLDHRSYERQELELIPQLHEGPAVRAMENRGIATDKGDYNRWVRRHNEMVRNLGNKIKELSEWLFAAKDRIKEKEPSVRQLLIRYMDIQGEGARNYSFYGRQKANTKTLKTVATMTAYLDEHGINTVEQLEEHLEKLSESCKKLKSDIDTKNARAKQLKELIREAKAYKENLPVYEKWKTIHFQHRKDAYREKHKTEFTIFQSAKRTLAKAGMKEYSPETVKVWRAELAKLEKSHEGDYSRFCAIRDEKDNVRYIKYCIERALEGTPPERKRSTGIER